MEQLDASDLEEVLDLVTVAFAEHGETTPRQLLKPHVYRAEAMHEHYGIRTAAAAKHHRQLLAIASVSLRVMHLAGARAPLRIGAVGGVAVHPRLGRNQRFMSRLMMRAVADMRAPPLDDANSGGVALAMLSGLRQRYAHFGFETAGTAIALDLTTRNFERGGAVDAVLVGNIRLQPLKSAAAHHLVAAARALHAQQCVWCDRGDSGRRRAAGHREEQELGSSLPVDTSNEEFVLFLRAWNARPFAAIDTTTGECVGYLVADAAAGMYGAGRSADGSRLREFVATSDAVALAMIYRFALDHGTGFGSKDPSAKCVHLELSPWVSRTALGQELLRVAEDTSVKANCQFLVLDWVATVDALLGFHVAQSRATAAFLPTGRVVVSVTDGDLASGPDHGTAATAARAPPPAVVIALEVALDDGILVGHCTAAKPHDTVDIRCADELMATRLLLGPLPCATTMTLPGTEAARCLSAWCPLPLHVAKQDEV